MPNKHIIKKGVRNYDTIAMEELGATHARRHHVEVRKDYFSGKFQYEPFSTHYFNENDEEVGYVIYDMVELSGLCVFDTPRIWSNDFKLHHRYSKPVDLKTLYVTNKGYVGENKLD